ncbi:conserved hypothetical protein [Candidatus Terasakiella magnetica]|uniref:Uncharacterized protein n=1 Tax=Candidatus Terasakiella magnetica TaxID=1867952 RepID=A0A1C3RFM7_9PROT|nr:hypothetical protein [Candidatus Terasakiella magnetica]SCA56014.1 conserved hypothetical protein [Candidatus Terasakiella magnetica]
MVKELTRKELFDKVWSMPMTKLAAEYGISDVGLKQICDKHRIPVPGRGYWAKVAAGKKVKKTHFREVKDPSVNRIRIYGSAFNKLPEPVKKAQEEAKKVSQKQETEVTVETDPTDLFPKVERSRKKLRSLRVSSDELIKISGSDLFDLSIGTESIDRTITFLNTLHKASEERKYKIVKGDNALVFYVDEESLSFSVVEQTTRREHLPTEKELAALKKWEKQQERRRYNWHSVPWTPKPNPPEWDYIPNGKLQVKIHKDDYACNGIRRTFGDGKVQRIEKLINPILESLASCAAAVKERRAERERWKRESEERQKREAEQRRINSLENKRIEALTSMLEKRKLSREIMDFVQDVEEKLATNDYENPERVLEWIEWAKGHALKVDPISEGLPLLLQFNDFNRWEL